MGVCGLRRGLLSGAPLGLIWCRGAIRLRRARKQGMGVKGGSGLAEDKHAH